MKSRWLAAARLIAAEPADSWDSLAGARLGYAYDQLAMDSGKFWLDLDKTC
jgi:hypothetical protein